MESRENIASQLELLGLDEIRRRAELIPNPSARSRIIRRAETIHDLLTEMPSADNLSFLHAGLCQTCLPHSRPARNHTPWKRESGRFTLLVRPGLIDKSDPREPSSCFAKQPTDEEFERDYYVGVPYGTKARLIMIHLQTEGMRSRIVSLGPSLSSFLRSLGLDVRGGPRGTIVPVREQCLRIARCTFTLQWSGVSNTGDEHTIISDTNIV